MVKSNERPCTLCQQDAQSGRRGLLRADRPELAVTTEKATKPTRSTSRNVSWARLWTIRVRPIPWTSPESAITFAGGQPTRLRGQATAAYDPTDSPHSDTLRSGIVDAFNSALQDGRLCPDDPRILSQHREALVSPRTTDRKPVRCHRRRYAAQAGGCAVPYDPQGDSYGKSRPGVPPVADHLTPTAGCAAG